MREGESIEPNRGEKTGGKKERMKQQIETPNGNFIIIRGHYFVYVFIFCSWKTILFDQVSLMFYFAAFHRAYGKRCSLFIHTLIMRIYFGWIYLMFAFSSCFFCCCARLLHASLLFISTLILFKFMKNAGACKCVCGVTTFLRWKEYSVAFLFGFLILFSTVQAI